MIIAAIDRETLKWILFLEILLEQIFLKRILPVINYY